MISKKAQDRFTVAMARKAEAKEILDIVNSPYFSAAQMRYVNKGGDDVTGDGLRWGSL